MTEKRFILVEYVNKGLFIQDNANDETQYFQGSKASLEKVVNLLNNLNDENEQLKRFFIIQQNNFTKEDELKITVREDLYNLCNKINNKMKEVYIKTPNTCYIDYKNQLYELLKKMDKSIESFKRELLND